MKFYFFPRNKTFWLYHGSIVTLITLVQVVIVLLWRDEAVAFNLMAGSLWLPLFTIAVLYYRYLYKKNHWQERGTASNILIVTLYSSVAGFLVAGVMLGITMPFFWDDALTHNDIASGKITVEEIIIQHVIGNGLQTQIFIAGWIFIYISIISKQRIKETELTNLRLQNSLKEAQLSNLTNQLNPHFLFNALNNIRFTIYENQHKADLMLTALAEVLRYSLQTSQKPKVRLEQELAMVNRYIDIIKIQMEERLVFTVNVPEPLNDYLIPPMLLQLLIENSIKHGVDNLRAGGTVLLKAEKSNRHLMFQISNTAPENIDKPIQKIGIGLKNIEQRLALLYGQEASFHIHHQSAEFLVQLTIPCEREE